MEDPKVMTGPWTTPKMRRGKLKHDFSSFDPCIDDSHELALTIDAITTDTHKLKLSQDALHLGITKYLESEAAK